MKLLWGEERIWSSPPQRGDVPWGFACPKGRSTDYIKGDRHFRATRPDDRRSVHIKMRRSQARNESRDFIENRGARTKRKKKGGKSRAGERKEANGPIGRGPYLTDLSHRPNGFTDPIRRSMKCWPAILKRHDGRQPGGQFHRQPGC